MKTNELTYEEKAALAEKWGLVSVDEFFVKQCGDFEIEDMERAYNKGSESRQEEIDNLTEKLVSLKKIIPVLLDNIEDGTDKRGYELPEISEAKQFLREEELSGKNQEKQRVMRKNNLKNI